MASILVIFSIFFGLFWILRSSEEITPSLRPAAPETEKISELSENITGKESENAFLDVLPPEKKDDEILRNALKNRQKSECDALSSEKMMIQCREGISLAIALEKKSLDPCDDISNEDQWSYCRDQVWFFLARDNKNFEGCSQIQNKTTAEQCQRLAERNQVYSAQTREECDTLVDMDFRKMCQERFVIRTDTKKEITCDFSDAKKQQECEIEKFAQESFQKGSVSACDQIEKESDRKKCLFRVQGILIAEERDEAIRQGDTTSCLTLLDAGEKKYCLDRAFFVQAENEHEVSLCEKIENKRLRESCANQVSKNASAYFFEKAKQEKNPLLCERITSISAKVSCQNLFQ